MQLMSAILYGACWVHVGSSSWRNPTTSGTKMGQWPVTLLPIGKPKAKTKSGRQNGLCALGQTF